jgi:hypothetical protein
MQAVSQHWIDCPHCGDRFGIQVPPPAVHFGCQVRAVLTLADADERLCSDYWEVP